jgi:hypothetical protein
MNVNQNFAPRVATGGAQLSQPRRAACPAGTSETVRPGGSIFPGEEPSFVKSTMEGKPESKIPACNGVESEGKPDDVTNHIGKLEVREMPAGTPGCSIRPIGISHSSPGSTTKDSKDTKRYSDPETDLCLWEDLEIGEAFYLPFMRGVYFKTGIESFGIAPNEPEWEWRVAGEGREPVWLVARAEDLTGRVTMQCRRCDCTELNPCFSFTDGACAWARPGLCTACLTDPEVRRFLQEGAEAA